MYFRIKKHPKENIQATTLIRLGLRSALGPPAVIITNFVACSTQHYQKETEKHGLISNVQRAADLLQHD